MNNSVGAKGTTNYYDFYFSDHEVAEIFCDRGMISAWLEFEKALAVSQAKVGYFSKEIAEEIGNNAKFKKLNLGQMQLDLERVGFPIVPLINQLKELCSPEARPWVHYGATTQDVIDTGTVLQMRAALKVIKSRFSHTIKILCTLTQAHRETIMIGRTFQQQAAPLTFGYKSAVWLMELMRHWDRLNELEKRLTVGQLGGAVGTLATLGEKGALVQKEMMSYLGLNQPKISWHTSRDSWSEVICWLAMTTASFAKIATEVAFLMRTEVGELSEAYTAGRGSSSTMPQKRNPILAQSIIAIAHKARAHLDGQLLAMIQEHERGLGHMHLEWKTVSDVFVLTGASLRQSQSLLEGLTVHKEVMQKNIDDSGYFFMSESIMMALAPKIGRSVAHALVKELGDEAMASNVDLPKYLYESQKLKEHLSDSDLEYALEPKNYLGSALEMVDNVLLVVKEGGFSETME